ncbi:leucine-rich repeat protein kinase family protein [Striga asiatica]|uniref:Leucine-rich repeat protein kinase family protein n=1 Tax=Striga asiatica TaxID=4170 RepID=A0A5A7PE84_STRAF|nr:leucine-rich repeat protein kinase family protein [Striga asiatica]
MEPEAKIGVNPYMIWCPFGRRSCKAVDFLHTGIIPDVALSVLICRQMKSIEDDLYNFGLILLESLIFSNHEKKRIQVKAAAEGFEGTFDTGFDSQQKELDDGQILEHVLKEYLGFGS